MKLEVIKMKGSVRKRGEKWSYYFTVGIVDGKRKIKEKGGSPN